MQNQSVQVQNSKIGETYIFGPDSGNNSPLALPDENPENHEILPPKK